MAGSTTTGAAVTLGTFLAASPFGIPGTDIAAAAALGSIGVICRGVFEAQRNAQGIGTMKARAILAWVAAGLFGAPLMGVVYLIGLQVIGVPTNSLALLFLWWAGFSGPKGLLKAWGQFAAFIKKKFNITLPGLTGDDNAGA